MLVWRPIARSVCAARSARLFSTTTHLLSFQPHRATPSTFENAAAPTPTAKPAPASAPAPRKSRLRTPRKAAIKLTPAAVSQLRDLLDQPNPQLIRVGVRNRGCSGLAYHLEYVDKPGPFDEKVEQDGVTVLIDSKALFSIIGSEMDWAEENLMEKFVFKNPNISESPSFQTSRAHAQVN